MSWDKTDSTNRFLACLLLLDGGLWRGRHCGVEAVRVLALHAEEGRRRPGKHAIVALARTLDTVSAVSQCGGGASGSVGTGPNSSGSGGGSRRRHAT